MPRRKSQLPPFRNISILSRLIATRSVAEVCDFDMIELGLRSVEMTGSPKNEVVARQYSI